MVPQDDCLVLISNSEAEQKLILFVDYESGEILRIEQKDKNIDLAWDASYLFYVNCKDDENNI